MRSQRLVVNPRSQKVTARQIRRQGYVPGVVYGSNQNTVPVEVDSKSLVQMIKKYGQSALFEIAMENGIDAVRIKEIQRDPVTRDIIHIDMQRVEANKKIQTEVPLKFEGLQNAGSRGTVIQYQKNTVKVEGYAKDIPSFIQVNVKKVKPGQAFRVCDLEVSEELTIVDNMNDLIFTAIKGGEYENSQEEQNIDNDEQNASE